MALIQCPECKAEVSEKASSCPKCGHPINATVSNANESPKKQGVSLIRNLIGVAVLLTIVVFVYKVMNEVSKPPLPVECQYRRALLANGYVEIFTNKSNKVLSVLATFENPTFKTTKSYRLNLNPNVPVQFGHLQGWDFTAGDKITLVDSSYQTAHYSVP
jgi:hypothetical protein